jgi:hypothetical protein
MRIGKPALGSEKRSSVVCKGEERRGEKSHTKLDFFYYSSKKKITRLSTMHFLCFFCFSVDGIQWVHSAPNVV